MTAEPRIRVLVVDDSAFARKVLRDTLSQVPDIEVVGIARDGLEALEKIADLKPDVVTLDLVMPGLDGMGVLAALPVEGRPRIVIVCISSDQSPLAIAALQAGATEVVQKPTPLAIDRLYDIADDLVAAVRAAALARSPEWPRASRNEEIARQRPHGVTKRILVIGASTGGPQALTRLLKALPAELPVPVAVILHLPPGYTATFAARMNDESALDVQEASEGLLLRPGLVVVGRAGMHLRFQRTGAQVSAHLDLLPADSAHRPSVDVLFESAAEVYGAAVLGVVLTGMGDDGFRGSKAIGARGGQVLTETEESCVVYGMPRVVQEAGLSSGQASVDEMPAEILRML
jgi:two-component system chemotaxis response regulator CheB